MSEYNYFNKYLKYKRKYINLKNMKGGELSKSETLELINKLDTCSINDICTLYSGVDQITYRFIEVPQGHIYKYDGNDVIDLGTGKIIASGSNIILSISDINTCRGLIIYETDRILMGHLDGICMLSPLTLQTIEESLSGDKEKINIIYYVMGILHFDSSLKEKSPIGDISTEVFDIIQRKKLEKYVCIVKDFMDVLTHKICYNWEMDEFMLSPLRPTITNRFLTEEEEEEEYMKQMDEIHEGCENIRNKLIRRKNGKKYQNDKSKCMSCNFKIESRGKGNFLCSEF